MVALDELCHRKTGNRDPRARPDEFFTYVDISSVDNQRKRIDSPQRIRGRDASSRARQIIFERDVLVSTTRPNLNAVALVPRELHEQVASTGFCILRPNSELDSDYLFAFVQSSDFVRRLSDLVKGALYPAVTDGQVRLQRIPFPPLAEQRRIAARLREELGAVDEARAALVEQIAAAEALSAAHLRAVFQSSASVDWRRVRVGDVAEIIQNGVYKPAEQYRHGLPFVRMYNLTKDRWALDLARLAKVNLTDREQDTFALRPGDLLVSRVNSFELVGKCAWVGPEAEGHVFENMLIRVRLRPEANSLLVAQQFATAAVRTQIERVAKRAIGQASINSDDLRKIEVVLPDRDQQAAIASRLDAEVESALALRAELAAKLADLEKLPAALLRAAFAER